MELNFDPACFDLALYFFPDASEDDLNKLAQLIQDQVEMFEPSE